MNKGLMRQEITAELVAAGYIQFGEGDEAIAFQASADSETVVIVTSSAFKVAVTTAMNLITDEVEQYGGYFVYPMVRLYPVVGATIDTALAEAKEMFRSEMAISLTDAGWLFGMDPNRANQWVNKAGEPCSPDLLRVKE